MTNASTKVVLTKEEKIAKIKQNIAALEVKLFNVENDIVTAPRAKKEAPLPNVGDTVRFNYGRKTATTEPVTITGTVVAIKPKSEVNGKTLPAQIKVSYGEGFDAAFATIYPAQVLAEPEQAQSVTDLYNGTAE